MPVKKRESLLTTVELLTLTAVGKLGEANNVQIFDLIREVYPSANFPTIYTALVRMTWKKLVAARTGEVQPMRGGRARKLYRITPRGEEELNSTTEVLTAASSIRGLRPRNAL